MHELQEALQSFAYPCAARDCKLRVQGASCMALHDNFLTGSRRCALHRFRINSITFIGMLTGRENGKAFWILHFFFFGGEVMHPKINNFFVPANNILDHHTASFRFRGSSPGIFSGFHAGLDYPHHLSTCKRTVKVDAWLALPLAWLPPDN